MNKKLNEQFEKTRKNVLCEVTEDPLKVKKLNAQIEELQGKVAKLSIIESAYNSDKKMF